MHMLVRDFARELLQSSSQPGRPCSGSPAQHLDSAAHGASAGEAVALKGSPQQLTEYTLQGTASMPQELDSRSHRSAGHAFTAFMLECGRQHLEDCLDLARQPRSAMHCDELANFQELARVLEKTKPNGSEKSALADNAVRTARVLAFHGQLGLSNSICDWAALRLSGAPQEQELVFATSQARLIIADRQGDSEAILAVLEKHISLCNGTDMDVARQVAQLAHNVTRLGAEAAQYSVRAWGSEGRGEVLDLLKLAEQYPKAYAVLEEQRTPTTDSLMGILKMGAGQWQARPASLAWGLSAQVDEDFESTDLGASCAGRAAIPGPYFWLA